MFTLKTYIFFNHLKDFIIIVLHNLAMLLDKNE